MKPFDRQVSVSVGDFRLCELVTGSAVQYTKLELYVEVAWTIFCCLINHLITMLIAHRPSFMAVLVCMYV